MEIRFAEITRGNGKIFQHVEVSTTSKAAGRKAEVSSLKFVATSVTAEGRAVPARLLTAPEGIEGKVLVAPVLPVSQTVTVRAVAPDGTPLAEATEELDPQVTKRHSQLNTALRNKVALAIRNCDEGLEWGSRALRINVLRLIDHNEEDIAHIELLLERYDRAALDAPLTLGIYDLEGHDLTLGEPIVLGDSTQEDLDIPGFYHRRRLVSVRLPHGIAFAVAWARSESSAFPERVEQWDSQRFADMHRKWFYDSLAADRDPIYDEWFRTRQRAKGWELAAQREATFPVEPCFSLVVPLYHTPLEFFREMADSVLNQTYGHLQLVLVNSTPGDEALSNEVATYASRDQRVTVVTLQDNLGIVGNTNAGIARAMGDFVCFFDHDDVLEPDLLFWYAKAINDYPTTDLLYCDEDKLNNGHYEQVFLKPDWSPDLLRSQNYVTHLLTVRRSLLTELGGLDPAFEGAQDHDLTLRVGERARNVFHLRKVRYHWRMHQGSTATAGVAKTYTQDAGKRAVQAELDRLHVQGAAYEDERIPNLYHVRYNPTEQPLVSIVIPNKDAANLLKPCVDSILAKSTYHNFEIVVVENNSTERETFELYRELEARDARVHVVTYVPGQPGFNFAKIMNYGIRHSSGEYVLMLNNDIEVITPNWLECLLGHALEKRVGCVGGKLLYPDGTIQHAGVIVHKGGPSHSGIYMPHDTDNYFHAAQTTRNFLGVTGACLLVRRSIFDELGGINECFAVDFNDVDFCLRVRDAGYWNVYEPTCELYHYESVSRGKNDTPQKKCRFRAEGARIESRYPQLYEITDPFMNPNMWPINPYWHLQV